MATQKNDLLSMVKRRLKDLQDNTQKTSGVWKPTGDHTIRIVPYKFATVKDWPFIELYFHYDFNKKNLLSPISFDKPDPIVEFADKLKSTADKESRDLAKKIYPKMRTYVPIIVRGEEAEGVKFYGMGKTVYEEILKIMDDPDYGNISDPYTGTDLVITYQTKEEVGNDFGKTSIRAKRNTSKLAESEEQIEKFLNNQKPITDVYKEHTYEELQEMLEAWMNSDDDKENTSEIANTESKEKQNVDEEKVVAKADDAFNKLFNKNKQK